MSGPNDICRFSDLDREICQCRHCKDEAALQAPNALDQDGVYADIPSVAYHAHDSLSSSGARRILRSPAAFKWDRDYGAKNTSYFDQGRAAHTYVLGEGDPIEVIDAEDWRTSAAKKARTAAYAAGKVPLLAHEDATAQAMAVKVRANAEAARLLAHGQAEMSLSFMDPMAWVRLRSRPDWLTEIGGRIVILDYKTTQNGAPQSFPDSAARYGYHQQGAFCRAAVRELEIAHDPRFVLIVQEKEPPYLVSLFEYESHDLDIGDRLNRRAIDLYAHCRATNTWPGYGDHIHTLRLPRWARDYE